MKEVEMSGDCEEVRKRIDTLISIEGELLGREVKSLGEYAKRGVMRVEQILYKLYRRVEPVVVPIAQRLGLTRSAM
ncbi:MAG: hypothetical protein ACPL3C_09800, partial [Pyrobaculum sp.]